MRKWMLAVALGSFVVTAAAQEPRNVSELAGALEALRIPCVEMARNLQAETRSDRLERELQDKLEAQEIRNEVSLYRIGHGARQTERYMMDLMQQKARRDSEASVRAVKVQEERGDQVSDCLSQALDEGKSLYARSKAKVGSGGAASSLMTAWVVNMESVSMHTPDGSEASHADWQKAKTSAELESL